MPSKRNRVKKKLVEKTEESSKEKTNKEMSSHQDNVDPKIQSSSPHSPSEENTEKPSASFSVTSVPTSSITCSSNLRTDQGKETEQRAISAMESVNPSRITKTDVTNSKDIIPEASKEYKDKNDSSLRPLKQMLLSPKSDSAPSKTKKKNKTKSSKGNRKETTKQSSISEYFGVRRSQRKVKSKLEEEKKNNIEQAVLGGKEEGIEVKNVEGKGRGIFAVQPFKKGDFVCEYHGEHINYDTAKKREKKYSEDANIGCYMYYFTFKNKKLCVDATQESGRLGRLLNHSINGNCTTKLISIKDKPYLILVAAKDITPGSELLYDYGERSKDIIASHPWLQA